MAGRKLFTNTSSYGMTVTLLVRASEDPRNQAGSVEFWLDQRQSTWQDYGDAVNIYLNGFELAANLPGDIYAKQSIVVKRGSRLDDELNMFNAVDFGVSDNGTFSVSTRQV